jgi:hypothetical protein
MGGGMRGGGGMGGGMRGGGGMGGGMRGGMGGMGGGFRGGNWGGGFRGGNWGGGFRGGSFGFRGNGFRGFGFRGFGFRGSGFGWGGWGWPWWGWGYPVGFGYGASYWPGYGGYYGDPYGSYPSYDPYAGGYDPYAGGYANQGNNPNVTVVYPQAPTPPTTVIQAAPAYDEYGQAMNTGAVGANSASSSSPIYLIAMRNGAIEAAASYWIEGGTLHYVTLQHQEKQVLVSGIDRTLTSQLNRDRHIMLILPAQ